MTTPVGMFSDMVRGLQLMVADSLAFQSWVGAVDQEEALERVHVISAPIHGPLPMALVEVGELVRQRSMVFSGYQFEYGPGTHLVLSFRSDADGEDEPEAGYSFLNALGGIMEDIEKASGNQATTAFTIPVTSLAAPPQRIISPNRQSIGDYYEASFIIQKGVRP
jgi:hypothetical protein